MKESRSTIASENLQEILDSESSAGSALFSGAAQYFTPPSLEEECRSWLPDQSPSTVLDPQSGTGNLLRNLGRWSTDKYGIELDNRITSPRQAITSNCVKVFEAIEDLYPGLRWSCIVANPPFGKRWKTASGKVVDSTELTWKFAIAHANYGYFIASRGTVEKLGIHQHKWVTRYEVRGNVWPGVSVEVGIVVWQRPTEEWDGATGQVDMRAAWERISKIIDEEKAARPKFNIYLDSKGHLRTYLSTRSEMKLKLDNDQIKRLHRVNDAHPLSLTVEVETRRLMADLINAGIYTIQPEAKRAIEEALREAEAGSVPIRATTPFEDVAYADEMDCLTCIETVKTDDYKFTAGKAYKLTTGTYQFTNNFTRNKVHFNEKTGETYTQEHTCSLSGQDRFIQVMDDRHKAIRFMDKPIPGTKWHLEESLLWKIFKRPTVPTIAEVMPDVIEHNLSILRSCEMLSGYKYYPGQLNYLATIAAKNYGLVAGEGGTGKTLFAISLLAMKSPHRAIIVAPQGTMRSSESDDEEDGEDHNPSQWISEIHRFAPFLQIWEIFSYEDYRHICAQNGGELPPGVYVTYYEAFFRNQARESAPESWDDKKLEAMYECTLPDFEGKDKRHWCESIGKEVDGIRCIITPCLATKIGGLFDAVLLDEAHIVANLDALVSQMLIRLQPTYRYALTATPISNVITNIFSLMGWLTVRDWYKGGRLSAAWPYAREDVGRFNETFLTQERDFTQEQKNRQRDPEWRGTCTKPSPVISSPARLLKLLKPTMAYISKQECRAEYKPPTIIDVSVPMGQEQSKLYAYYLNRANVPGNHPLVRARRQTAFLRAICADPAGFRHGNRATPKVTSNMNPKVIAVLEIVRDKLKEGEQITIISSRIGLTNAIQHRLNEAGVATVRIDSTIPAAQHSHQANLFKAMKAPVMLMGLRCAASHSFGQCKYEIIAAIDYSPGPFNQAKWRIDRVISRAGVTIYCVLHKNSIEELMFETVSLKDDAATICLKGQRVPRDFKPVDASEVLASAIDRFDVTGATPESECEVQWPVLRDAIENNLTPLRVQDTLICG